MGSECALPSPILKVDDLSSRPCSRVGSEPVSLNLVGLEHLFSELLVASVLDGIDLKSVRVGVNVVVLGEQVADRVEGGNDAANHANNDLLVRDLALAEIAEVL